MHAEPVFDCFILRTKLPLSSTQRESENVSFVSKNVMELLVFNPSGICELAALDMDVVVLGAPSHTTKKNSVRFCVANVPIALENCLHGRMLYCMIHTRCLLGERKRMRGYRLRSPLEPAHPSQSFRAIYPIDFSAGVWLLYRDHQKRLTHPPHVWESPGPL